MPLLLTCLALAAQGELRAELIADSSDGLVDPITMASIPGDDRLFVIEREGQVRILRGGVVVTAPMLDIRSELSLTVSTGLRAIAFHPNHAVNRELYLWYDAPSTNGAIVDIVLGRMSIDANDPDRVDPTSLVEILREPQQNFGHGGGNLEFGPDGMLYAALGDGGQPQDPNCNAQNPSSLMGCMLRIDVDGAFPYEVPADNPFVGNALVRDEIWQQGLRHPWKWSFDRGTGELWISDVGDEQREEVNVTSPGSGGQNFGWKVMEGSVCFNTQGCASGIAPCGDPSYTLPLYEYDHSVGCSITGGYVYRGSAIPWLQGQYLFADWCSGRFWTFRKSGQGVTGLTERTAEIGTGLGGAITSPVAFGEDGFGELYLIDYDGKELYRITRREDIVSYCVAAPNAVGPGGRLGSAGTTSLAANDLELRALGLPGNTFAIPFFGPQTAETPAGNGFVCVGGAIVRLPVVQAGGAGNLIAALDSATVPLSTYAAPGSTFAFQCWYRDVGGPLGQTYNFTNGLSVLFRP